MTIFLVKKQQNTCMTIFLVVYLFRRIDILKIKDMQLTKAEEQVMQHLWEMGEGLVKDIRDRFDDPKPVRNTVSTVLRILEKKNFVSHRTYGNVHVYYPLVSKEEYSKSQLFGLMKSYFNNSFPTMASFFAREKDLSIRELEQLMEETKRELSKK
jgi:BlaI family transcriptional regulator, penicillinase repressor